MLWLLGTASTVQAHHNHTCGALGQWMAFLGINLPSVPARKKILGICALSPQGAGMAMIIPLWAIPS